MQNIDSRRDDFVNCVGLVVIGLAVLLFALGMIVSIRTVLGSGQNDARPLLTINAEPDFADRSPALPSVVF